MTLLNDSEERYGTAERYSRKVLPKKALGKGTKERVLRSLAVCRRSSTMTGEEGEGGRGAKSYECKKAWPSVNPSKLSVLGVYPAYFMMFV